MSPPLPRAWLVFLAASTLSQLGNSVLWFALGWAAASHGGQVAASYSPRPACLGFSWTVRPETAVPPERWVWEGWYSTTSTATVMPSW